MAEPLSTEGARRYGGRWNPVGLPVLYCSGALSLAALEVLVHVQAGKRSAHYHAVCLEVPDGEAEQWAVKDLPKAWRSVPCDLKCQTLGGQWLQSGKCLALRVPSVIVPQECNVLLNPKHPDYARVTILESHPFPFDPRLLQPSGERVA